MHTGTAVLLIHGFTGSPAEMSWLAQQLEQQGFGTALPTLCGHDSEPEAMADCSYENWIQDVEMTLHELQAYYGKIFVIGLSMGGTLALHLACKNSLAGVITLAAPVKLSTWQELGARLLYPIIQWREKSDGSDIRDQNALSLLRSYDRYPTKAALELFKLLRVVRDEIGQIGVPILVIHSRQDHSVPVRNAALIYKKVQSQHKKILILENSYHILPLDVEKEIIANKIIQFIQEISQKIDE